MRVQRQDGHGVERTEDENLNKVETLDSDQKESVWNFQMRPINLECPERGPPAFPTPLRSSVGQSHLNKLCASIKEPRERVCAKKKMYWVFCWKKEWVTWTLLTGRGHTQAKSRSPRWELIANNSRCTHETSNTTPWTRMRKVHMLSMCWSGAAFTQPWIPYKTMTLYSKQTEELVRDCAVHSQSRDELQKLSTRSLKCVRLFNRHNSDCT